MKKILPSVFLLLTTLVLGFQYEYIIGPVSVEQAKQAIIQWSGRTNLDIQYMPPDNSRNKYLWETPIPGASYKLHLGIQGIHYPHGRDPEIEEKIWYPFTVTDPNPDKKYEGIVYVDSFTGEVTGIMKTTPDVKEGTVDDMIPPRQAIERAKEIVSAYFPNIPLSSFEGIWSDPKITPNGSWEEYCFSIAIRLYNRVLTPNGKEIEISCQEVVVEMDSQTGELYRVGATYEPLEINPMPTLSEEEATQAIISYLYGLGATNVEVKVDIGGGFVDRIFPNGPQVVAYGGPICFVEKPSGAANIPAGLYVFTINANTGEVLTGLGLIAMGAPLPTKHKPANLSVLFNGKEAKVKPLINNGIIYLRVADLKGIGFEVLNKKDGFLISYKKQGANFGGKEVLRKGKETFIRGESLRKIKGIMTSYWDKGKKFHIWVINEKAYRRGQLDKARLEKDFKNKG
jgi:hypothetical protein